MDKPDLAAVAVPAASGDVAAPPTPLRHPLEPWLTARGRAAYRRSPRTAPVVWFVDETSAPPAPHEETVARVVVDQLAAAGAPVGATGGSPHPEPYGRLLTAVRDLALADTRTGPRLRFHRYWLLWQYLFSETAGSRPRSTWSHAPASSHETHGGRLLRGGMNGPALISVPSFLLYATAQVVTGLGYVSRRHRRWLLAQGLGSRTSRRRAPGRRRGAAHAVAGNPRRLPAHRRRVREDPGLRRPGR